MPAVPADPEQSGTQLAITRLSSKAGLRLAGEVDVSNHLQLRSALTHLSPEGGTTLHLELSGLRFVDVAGTSELLAHVQADPSPRLILHDPPLSLRRIIALLWPDADVEIQLEDLAIQERGA